MIIHYMSCIGGFSVINEKMKIVTLQLIIFISLLIIPNIVTSNSSTVTIEKSEVRNINPEDVNSSQEKPQIVDHFACSGYCPMPDKDYWVKIYEGIKDKDECLKLGGRTATYYGWGEFHICIAE